MRSAIPKFFLLAALAMPCSTAVVWAQTSQFDVYATPLQESSGDADTTRLLARSPTGAMIRSLILPGWGQFYNRKYVKAVLVLGAELGLLANSIYLNQQYRSSDTEQEREFYINNRNLSTWWLIGTILFSMADAFVDAHLADFDENPDLSALVISPIGRGDKFSVSFSLHIIF